MALEQRVKALFDHILEPKLKWNINALNLLKGVRLEGETLVVRVNLVTSDPAERAGFRSVAEAALRQLHPGPLRLELGRVQVAVEGIDGVRRVVLVASGKGGVGKSTVAVNLAAALAARGQAVGLMDADLYGPSVPRMMGTQARPEVADGERLIPIERHGVRFISAGSLLPPGKALDWRGQLVSGTILQFLRSTLWGALDTLVVDLPPGTGDVHLTIAAKVRANGVVLVTTPQEVAWGDLRRALDLLTRQAVPLLGVVENMSYLPCEACGHHNHPFVATGEELPPGIPLLARLPLARPVSESGDGGVPLVIAQPDSELARSYLRLAATVAESLGDDAGSPRTARDAHGGAPAIP